MRCFCDYRMCLQASKETLALLNESMGCSLSAHPSFTSMPRDLDVNLFRVGSTSRSSSRARRESSGTRGGSSNSILPTESEKQNENDIVLE